MNKPTYAPKMTKRDTPIAKKTPPAAWKPVPREEPEDPGITQPIPIEKLRALGIRTVTTGNGATYDAQS
jgi:hypothetical protein